MCDAIQESGFFALPRLSDYDFEPGYVFTNFQKTFGCQKRAAWLPSKYEEHYQSCSVHLFYSSEKSVPPVRADRLLRTMLQLQSSSTPCLPRCLSLKATVFTKSVVSKSGGHKVIPVLVIINYQNPLPVIFVVVHWDCRVADGHCPYYTIKYPYSALPPTALFNVRYLASNN